MKMSEAQFKCCLTGRSGPISEAARLVLVEGLTVAQAAAKTGNSEGGIRNAMTRITRRYKAICEAGPWPTNGG